MTSEPFDVASGFDPLAISANRVVGWSATDPDDMLRLAREALTDWRQAKDKSAAERRAARSIAFAFGRLDELAAGGHLPADWRLPDA